MLLIIFIRSKVRSRDWFVLEPKNLKVKGVLQVIITVVIVAQARDPKLRENQFFISIK